MPPCRKFTQASVTTVDAADTDEGENVNMGGAVKSATDPTKAEKLREERVFLIFCWSLK